MSICSAIKRNGDPCSRIANDRSGYCYSHDPDTLLERTFNNRNSAKSKGSEVRKVLNKLDKLYKEVHEGEIEAKVGAVLVRALQTKLQALKLEKDIQEMVELEEKIDELARSMGWSE